MGEDRDVEEGLEDTAGGPEMEAYTGSPDLLVAADYMCVCVRYTCIQTSRQGQISQGFPDCGCFST